MNRHAYLRAYLSGAFIPTLVLPLMLTAFVLLRLVLAVPFPIERGLVFPMALVPAGWGLWNMLWLALRKRTQLALGVHGAVLPFLLLPCGTVVARGLGVLRLGASSATWFQEIEVSYAVIACVFVFVLALYYMVWKYVVGFLNRLLDIA